MVTVTLQRNKCIGCAFCAEQLPTLFVISKKDGKCNLLHSQNKQGIQVAKLPFMNQEEQLQIAAEGCPVKIIKYLLK